MNWPIDTFIRVAPFNEIRRGMWHAVRSRWELEPVRLNVLDGAADVRLNRLRAEQYAQSPIYIVSDDDVLIMGKDWVRKAIKIMEAHPEYGVVSTLSIIEGENVWRPGFSGDSSEVVMDIYPVPAVGAPMLLRKGICADLPEMDLNLECGVICDHAHSKGFESGLFNPNLLLRHSHLGHGCSRRDDMRWCY